MWEADTSKDKWAVLAKAYSLIRDDQGTDETSLHAFLTINVPFIGIAAPNEYFQQLGYILEVVSADEYRLVRRQNEGQRLQNSTSTSVQDVLKYSFNKGFLKNGKLVANASSDRLAMATTPLRPSSTLTRGNRH